MDAMEYDKALEFADKAAKDNPERLSHEDVFGRIREKINAE